MADQRTHQRAEIPASVTTGWINLVGLGAACLALAWTTLQPQILPLTAALVIMAAYAVPIALLEMRLKGVVWRPTTGLHATAPRYDLRRSATKLLGFTAMITTVAACHAVFRVYDLADLAPAYAVLTGAAPYLLIAALLYIPWVDARMERPKDGYWQVGAWLTRQSQTAEVPGLRPFALGWVIKGFFLPIMFFYLTESLANMPPLHAWFTQDWVTLTRMMMLVAVILELIVVCVGYTLTLRLFDAHIRSTNPVVWGWLVTLVCYAPFNTVITGQVFNRDTGVPWHETIASYPLIAGPWLIALIVSFAVWVWATASFGLRWSNLTNRGVITCGPYRWMKHPDYMSKVTFFWLTSVPFLSAVPLATQIAATGGMCAVTLIYWGRAKAEELHMSEDPDYVRYALALNTRGLCAPIYRLFPALGYRAPDAPRPKTQGAAGAMPAE